MAKKNVAAVISGAGWIANFTDQLIHGLRERGCSEEEIHGLITARGKVPMAQIIDAIAESIRGNDPMLTRDMRKEGWKLLEHVSKRITCATDLELVSFLKGNESYLNGKELMWRARTELNVNYGQEDAEWLLERQIEIPEEFRNFILLFTGSVWGFPGGNRRVACLDWDGRRWILFFRWLDADFLSYYRLVRPCK